ncbi:hypothetical protein E6O75_ATG08820 [Venturia nashicola]|uniref:Uncharacterized protein n=1 Tax=Venturia nashicola TaxID=86259 RepID=A0A4Z1P456_9PEZI|nr:hypothetical protein E6O75_ATG08820 [Venturia nashicola]
MVQQLSVEAISLDCEVYMSIVRNGYFAKSPLTSEDPANVWRPRNPLEISDVQVSQVVGTRDVRQNQGGLLECEVFRRWLALVMFVRTNEDLTDLLALGRQKAVQHRGVGIGSGGSVERIRLVLVMFVRAKEDLTSLLVLGRQKAVQHRGVRVGSGGSVKRIRMVLVMFFRTKEDWTGLLVLGRQKAVQHRGVRVRSGGSVKRIPFLG